MNRLEIKKIAEKSNSWPFVEARSLRDRLKKINSVSGLDGLKPTIILSKYR